MIDISSLVQDRVIELIESEDMIENNIKEVVLNKISIEELNDKVYEEISDQLDIDDEIEEAISNSVRDYIERM